MDLNYVRFFLAFLFIIGLIGLLAWVLRRIGFGGVRLSPAYRSKGRARRRLAVTEAANIDARHRLVLVRRDDIEHLILLGNNSDLVVERNITPPDIADGQAPSFENALQSAGEKRK